MTTRRAILQASVAGALASFAPAARGQNNKPPNILLLLSDDQRPDTIAALGNPIIQTPHLDNLVARGTRLLVAGDTTAVARALGVEPNGAAFDLPGVMSRKKQVAPRIMAALG